MKTRVLAMLLIAVLGMGLPSCKDDKDEPLNLSLLIDGWWTRVKSERLYSWISDEEDEVTEISDRTTYGWYIDHNRENGYSLGKSYDFSYDYFSWVDYRIEGNELIEIDEETGREYRQGRIEELTATTLVILWVDLDDPDDLPVRDTYVHPFEHPLD